MSVSRPCIPEFEAEGHSYTWEGRRITSITQYLQEWLEVELYGDAYFVNRFSGTMIKGDTFKAAGAFGTAIHKAAQLILTPPGLDMDALHPDLVPSVNALQYWLDRNVERVYLMEQPYYSARYDYCGTLDLLCKLKLFHRGEDLVEYKTGYYEMAEPQTAAQEQLVRENHQHNTEIRRWVLHIPKDGSPCKAIRLVRRDSFQYFLNEMYQKRWRDKA